MTCIFRRAAKRWKRLTVAEIAKKEGMTESQVRRRYVRDSKQFRQFAKLAAKSEYGYYGCLMAKDWLALAKYGEQQSKS